MHRSDSGSMKVNTSSGDIVCANVPLWACDVGIAAGYASAAMWFMVLLPQLHLNYQRGHCHGLSLLWALANFTASLINVFFAYRLNLPLYVLISAAYMPILEAAMLAQFWMYRHATSMKDSEAKCAFYEVSAVETRYRTGGTFLCTLWVGLVFLLVTYPELSPYIEWVAIALWSIEGFPQLWLNASLGGTRGQAVGSVLITVVGKTADVLSSYLVQMPVQTQILCAFSSSTAYLNAFQVLYYRYYRPSAPPIHEAEARKALLSAGVCANGNPLLQ